MEAEDPTETTDCRLPIGQIVFIIMFLTRRITLVSNPRSRTLDASLSDAPANGCRSEPPAPAQSRCMLYQQLYSSPF